MQFALQCFSIGLLVGILTQVRSNNKWSIVKKDNERCLFRVDRGPCHAKIERFGYDPFDNQCTVFYYGGCGGNPNRFHDQNECRRACKVTSAEYTGQYSDPNYTDEYEYGQDSNKYPDPENPDPENPDPEKPGAESPDSYGNGNGNNGDNEYQSQYADNQENNEKEYTDKEDPEKEDSEKEDPEKEDSEKEDPEKAEFGGKTDTENESKKETDAENASNGDYYPNGNGNDEDKYEEDQYRNGEKL